MTVTWFSINVLPRLVIPPPEFTEELPTPLTLVGLSAPLRETMPPPWPPYFTMQPWKLIVLSIHAHRCRQRHRAGALHAGKLPSIELRVSVATPELEKYRRRPHAPSCR